MVLVRAAKLQRLARLLQEVQQRIEEAGAEPGKVEDALRKTAEEVGMDLEVARMMDVDTVLRLLAPDPAPDPGRAWVAAEVLYLDGLRVPAGSRDEEARDRLLKARRLYRVVAESEPRLPAEATPPSERIRAVDALLEGAPDGSGEPEDRTADG